MSWWLKVTPRATPPNWDFVSTCRIGLERGLILIEAKAHEDELRADDHCGATNAANLEKIQKAIREASAALGDGWSLSDRGHYQLSNRFAWSWKIASLGVPVVLVYLGFLNASEMPKPFTVGADWEKCLRGYATHCVPNGAWESKIVVGGASFTPLIRSTDVNIAVL